MKIVGENGFQGAKKELFETILSSNHIRFYDFEYLIDGQCRLIERKILIEHSLLNGSTIQLLETIIHEYGHAFSGSGVKNGEDRFIGFNNKVVDEGTQDVFSELVLTHYLQKHGSIYINGKKVIITNSTSYTGYAEENNWVRTILYPSEVEGKLGETIMEYQLGDKRRYLEMVFGKEIAKTKKRDDHVNPKWETTLQEVYSVNKKAFERMTPDSILNRRNHFLPILILQNRLEKKGVDVNLIKGIEPSKKEKHGYGVDFEIFKTKKKPRYELSYIAELYFGKRKLLEIPEEEIKEFINYTDMDDGRFITDGQDWLYEMLSKITEEECENYSTELLFRFTDYNPARIPANILKQSMQQERKKIETGQQKIETTIKIYKSFIYEFEYDVKHESADELKLLKHSCICQMEGEINNGNIAGVIQMLKEEDGRILLEPDIRKMLDRKNITLEGLMLDETHWIDSKNGVLKIEEYEEGEYNTYSEGKNALQDCLSGDISLYQIDGVQIETPEKQGEQGGKQPEQ